MRQEAYVPPEDSTQEDSENERHRRAPSSIQWRRLEMTPEFRELIAVKKRTIIPATVFFMLYYFALPVSVGYFPEFMDTRVVGNVNLAYLFALSQFFVAWAIAAWYTNLASTVFDRLAAAVRRYVKGASA